MNPERIILPAAAVIGRVVETGFRFSDGTAIEPPREDALYDAFAR